MSTITIRQETFYVAYAPEFGVGAWGSCRDEALNNLTCEINQGEAEEEAGSESPSSDPSFYYQILRDTPRSL